MGSDDSGLMLTDTRVQQMADAELWRDRTILDFLDHRVSTTPDQVCVTDNNSVSGRGISTSGETFRVRSQNSTSPRM